jgi:hypothetical protein
MSVRDGPNPIWRRQPMDEKRFDTLARSLAPRHSSRRHVLGGVLGTAVTLLAGSSAMASRGKVRRAKRGNHGQDETATASDVLPDEVLVGSVLEETIEMCHYDPETARYRIVLASSVAVPERLSRGDTLYIDCCDPADCTSTDCLTATGCVSGACDFKVALNAPCHLEKDVFGICRSDAVCVPASS